jgi:hypothetical protein
LEAASPGKTLPSKQELLDFQARWMRPAGICAILGGLLIAASLPLQPSGGDNDAETLTKFHDQHTELIVGQGILLGIAILLFIPLLYVLIRSAQGRTERIRRGTISLAFIGPVLFAISGVLVAVGLSDVSDKFVEQAPAKERQAREQAAAAQAAAAKDQSAKSSKPSAQGGTTTATQPTTTPSGTTTTAPQAAAPTPRTPDQAAAKARDDLANDLPDDSGLLQAGSLLRFIGSISFVFAMIYIPLWAMRTGLLTRFWGTLGLALGVSLLLPLFGIFGLVLWFAAVGLMLARWWPVTLPPAWDAGEAIPWPSGRDDLGPPPAERGGANTVEGSGREVSEPGQPDASGEAPAQPGETQGQRRKKRKRRN